jgi:negative regulator of flagellin synthesis FlgM
MIDGVGNGGPGRIDLARADTSGKVAPVANAGARRSGGVESAVFELVSAGPPVDTARVAAIRSAIAEGRYPLDAGRIAGQMLALDLPQS